MKALMRNPFVYVSIFLFTLLVFQIAQIVRGQTGGTWAPPTAAPPGGQPEAPLDTGTSPQTKKGNLGVEGNLSIGIKPMDRDSDKITVEANTGEIVFDRSKTNLSTKKAAITLRQDPPRSGNWVLQATHNTLDPNGWFTLGAGGGAGGRGGVWQTTTGQGSLTSLYYTGGNVGIGTNNPQRALEVKGIVSATGFCQLNDKGGCVPLGTGVASGTGDNMWSTGADSGEIYYNGEVGINTPNPASALHVQSKDTSSFPQRGGITLQHESIGETVRMWINPKVKRVDDSEDGYFRITRGTSDKNGIAIKPDGIVLIPGLSTGVLSVSQNSTNSYKSNLKLSGLGTANPNRTADTVLTVDSSGFVMLANAPIGGGGGFGGDCKVAGVKVLKQVIKHCSGTFSCSNPATWSDIEVVVNVQIVAAGQGNFDVCVGPAEADPAAEKARRELEARRVRIQESLDELKRLNLTQPQTASEFIQSLVDVWDYLNDIRLQSPIIRKDGGEN